MSEYYVLDACALIAFLNDEAGADVVEELLRKSKPRIASVPTLFTVQVRGFFYYLKTKIISGGDEVSGD